MKVYSDYLKLKNKIKKMIIRQLLMLNEILKIKISKLLESNQNDDLENRLFIRIKIDIYHENRYEKIVI